MTENWEALNSKLIRYLHLYVHTCPFQPDVALQLLLNDFRRLTNISKHSGSQGRHSSGADKIVKSITRAISNLPDEVTLCLKDQEDKTCFVPRNRNTWKQEWSYNKSQELNWDGSCTQRKTYYKIVSFIVLQVQLT